MAEDKGREEYEAGVDSLSLTLKEVIGQIVEESDYLISKDMAAFIGGLVLREARRRAGVRGDC